MFSDVSELYGFSIRATDGDIGHVEDILFDQEYWGVRYLVVDTAPLFFGRKVLISGTAITELDWDDEAVLVEMTQDQVKDSPDIDTAQPVSEQELENLHTYYAWPIAWGQGHWNAPTGPMGLGGTAIAPVITTRDEQVPEPVQAADRRREEEWNPNLRSAKEVIGYNVRTEDGELGRIDDLSLNDENLSIRYLIADTGGLFDGRKVILCVDWIYRFSWTEKQVVVDLTQEQVRNAPPYDEDEPFTAEEEARLCEHYDK